MAEARNAANEADHQLGEGFAARVLEPSPPAVVDEYFADDPTRRTVAGAVHVGPVLSDKTWEAEVIERPDIADWARQRWLIPSRLAAVPAGLSEQREALHRLATYVVAPARHQVTKKFGLRWTKGGFGTPFFGNDKQVRVEGTSLVVQEASEVKSTEITTLAAAAEFIGSQIDEQVAAEHDSPPVGDINTDLGITADVVDFLDRWWGLGTAALEQVRAEESSIDPSRVQLWPGHFDPAIEVGDEDRRSSYGASPGDADSAEPYLYISVWWPDKLNLDRSDDYWNASGFVGARLQYEELAEASNPVERAVSFFREGRKRLIEA